MSSPVVISDDDDSFVLDNSKGITSWNDQETTVLSSDNEPNITSDEELPEVDVKEKKKAIIKKLFATEVPGKQRNKAVQKKAVPKPEKNLPSVSAPVQTKPKDPGFQKMIGGVNVNLPVNPYGSQIALMSKVITAIKKGQNCLLESPTGSGKTLALLCAALAWQSQEQNRLAQLQAQHYFSDFPELNNVEGAKEYITSPVKSTSSDIFTKTTFGEKSIYDSPQAQQVHDGAATNYKRQEPMQDTSLDSPQVGQVTIHKRRRLDNSDDDSASGTLPNTPEKPIVQPQVETPQSVRLPTIYYGARTHKQIQQVVKEFKRTWYCGDATMSLLSSREYSCIREFDKQLWGTKNDMCRGCIKPQSHRDRSKGESNCKFYDNRNALNHKSLPPAFDLEDLVLYGEQAVACPYYGARQMASSARIVFCPYNYLIEPGIRNSMQINLTDNIVIIDEAHNIEDICRDAATFSITRDNVLAALVELEKVASYRFAHKNQDIMDYIDRLIKTLKSWNDWFANQLPLVNNQPINNNEAVYTWQQVEHFVNTLNNHNIGLPHYSDFKQCAQEFCLRFREDPETLYGVSQSTVSLIEGIDTVFSYLFRESGKFMDDFKPVLIRTIAGKFENLPQGVSWRSSTFNQSIDRESISLRLLCMNPGVVFASLHSANCVILASGTLTPLLSLHSELATDFPLQVSPNHVIPHDRVWIGSLSTAPDGGSVTCTRGGAAQARTQDALGRALAWVCAVTPHGVLCFLPSYQLMNVLANRWRETGVWQELTNKKQVFMESRNVKDHNDVMEDYYKYAVSDKGALLLAVYRGKVSEGMDFKDQQARAVITIGVPYPNIFDLAVKEKMKYNDKYSAQRNLLPSREWLRVQAYRALNQAVGRCVRHRGDWGAVLLIDSRFTQNYYTEHLSKWVRNFLGNNHYTYDRLVNSPDSLESFMQNMTIRENEDVT